ncbi:MAG: HAMP domain-containing histidine kinase, partial [Clostridiales bacterium]|nr:HAMP domain-containing histidine kinase [Clostridiales bacterium]
MEDGVIKGKIAFNARTDEHEALVRNSQSQLITMLALIYAAGMILLVIIWYFYIRPFNKLSSFAANVSKGNLDTPLNMDKHNYFGAFTESFDRMREELKLSSEREAAANRSKQELVAELSHDIKTPVATIKATCEVMEIKYKEPDIREKVSVIKSKASSVEQLVDNLFRATLDDLEELKVTPKEESSLIIDDMFRDLRFYGTVERKASTPECLILVDRLRLEQVIDNIAGNSFKYAGTPLEVDFRSDKDSIRVIMSDRGPGVPEDELAMLTTKFYRGSEASGSGKDGSGLGLYLASLFMEKMGGGLELRNREGGGFTAEIIIKKVS